MKIRIRFGKYGEMKFVGHLDIMRYFQKCMRRAGVMIKYSGGFSPHQIMSFAQPLGVGVTSDGEYMDIDVAATDTSENMIKLLNGINVPGIRVYSYRLLPDNAKTGMAMVAAADYSVGFRYLSKVPDGWEDFMRQDNIFVEKTTKNGTSAVDIKPYIYESHVCSNSIFMKLSCGSVVNIKPEVVLGSFWEFTGKELNKFELLIHRQNMYASGGDKGFIALEDMGSDIMQPFREEN